jgi:hypothetical protein
MDRNQENCKTHDLYRTTDSVIYQIVHPNMQLGAVDMKSRNKCADVEYMDTDTVQELNQETNHIKEKKAWL